MKGHVADINWQRGMVGVLTENGDYSIFELLGEDTIEVGDEVYWRNDTSLGNESLKNVTKNVSFDVYFQNHHVTKSGLRKQLLY